MDPLPRTRDDDGNYLVDCVLCGQRLDDPVRLFHQFIRDPKHELYRYCGFMHWDCLATWEHRRRFAREYFEHEQWMTRYGHKAVAYLDEATLVYVLPDKWLQYVTVVLAETASVFTNDLENWEEWLEHKWVDHCQHDVEREALGDVLPMLRANFPTPRDLLLSAGIDPDEERPGDPHSPVGHGSYILACCSLAMRAEEQGLVCPLCGMFSTDYTFTPVKMAELDRLPYLTCPNCDGNFGPPEHHFVP